jgi:signal transduction histidine kinase
MSGAMFGATLQAALTLLVAAALATYVQLRGAHSPLRTPLLALLVALIVWSAGVIWRFAADTTDGAFAGLVVSWLGVATVPPLWLLMAARYARASVLERRPVLGAAPFMPAVLTILAIATNPYHELFFRGFTRDATPGRGPFFYVYLAYAYPMVIGGIALYLVSAWRIWNTDAWRRASLLTGAALLPTLASVLFILDRLPLPYDPTPAMLGISLVILTFGVFRYQLLEALPLARGDVIDQLRDGVLIADAEGRVVDANPGALAILDRGFAEVRGLRLGELLAPLGSNAAAVESLVARVEERVSDATAPPLELATTNERRIEITAKCLRGPDGGTLGRFAVLRDRTDERRTEALLRQSQKLETVGSLVAGVAHEVNNPLAFVQANLSQLERMAAIVAKRLPALDPGEAEELAEMPMLVAECTEGIQRIRRIVDAMRRFSRMPDDEFVPVDVNRVVEEAIRLADLHRNRDVLVQPLLEPGLPPAFGSAARLEQVFLNLLVNAKHALADQPAGRIEVATRLAGDIIEVSVRDDGPGVPEPLRHRIFDPFFTTKGPERGTGLGLSIAFDIVREHGGLLELRPTTDGGACFVTHLPIQGDAHERAAAS